MGTWLMRLVPLLRDHEHERVERLAREWPSVTEEATLALRLARLECIQCRAQTHLSDIASRALWDRLGRLVWNVNVIDRSSVDVAISMLIGR